MSKKIIISLSVIAVVAAIVVGGTVAYFSDTEVSGGNIFTAGELKLAIRDIAHSPDIGSRFIFLTENGFRFDLGDIKPLDEGMITYTLKNLENEAHLCVRVKDANENPTTEDEALKSMLNFKFNNLSGTFPGDYCQWSQWVSLGTMAGGQESPYSAGYCFGVYENGDCVLDNINYNPAQGGKMIVSVEFYAVQTRHNLDFDCSSLNGEEENGGTEECEWKKETAWSAGDRYQDPGNWATYTAYIPGSTVTLYAGQTLTAGTVHFSEAAGGIVTITVTLNEGWRFFDDEENVKIQDYEYAPSGNPIPGNFSHKGEATGTPFSINVPENNFYGVHIDTEWEKCE